MTEELISRNARKLEGEFKIAIFDAGTTQKKLATEFNTSQAQISRAIKSDPSPRSKVIREWLYSRLNMEVK